MACTTILFVVGSVSEIMVCNPLSDPMHSELFSVTADFYNLDHLYPPGEAPKITEIIRYVYFLSFHLYSLFKPMVMRLTFIPSVYLLVLINA